MALLHLSVSTHTVIGQFCGPYSTVWPTTARLVSFPVCLIKLRDIINILVTSFSQSVL